MDTFPVHQVWPKPSCKAQWKGEEDKADRGRGGKTTSGNGQVWSSPSPRGQWRIWKNKGNWLRNHLWCPNNPCGLWIDELRSHTHTHTHTHITHIQKHTDLKLSVLLQDSDIKTYTMHTTSPYYLNKISHTNTIVFSFYKQTKRQQQQKRGRKRRKRNTKSRSTKY